MMNRHERNGGELGFDRVKEVEAMFDFRGMKVASYRFFQGIGTGIVPDRVKSWTTPAIVSILFWKWMEDNWVEGQNFIWVDRSELLVAVPWDSPDAQLKINLSEGEELPEDWKDAIEFPHAGIFCRWNPSNEFMLAQAEEMLVANGLVHNQVKFGKVQFMKDLNHVERKGEVRAVFVKKVVGKGIELLRNPDRSWVEVTLQTEQELKDFLSKLSPETIQKFLSLAPESQKTFWKGVQN